ncbi:putative extracellular serine carboxypeptidase [Golovinomyces cichoracearum]|uniref:Putative extracellular serine carboxypeptidase n=1 Tax=Golovinomyces cichoracearum TaxID=62708 RepID=A0A420IL65_9PEZI|nr:putative extracellular serine carboxypeptidase [Golovinomyces cichoracearum]
MGIPVVLFLVSTLLCISNASIFRNLGQLVPPPLSIDEISDYSDVLALSEGSKNGSSFFNQLLDHQDPGSGTFQMKYWWNAEFWGGPGSPVVLFTPGESAAGNYTGYLTNHTLMGLFAKEIKGAVIMNLRFLTLNQSISDLTHFAKTVELPFDTTNSSNAGNAPWILTGGSYAGALAAWTSSTAPGTFWAYHASSAPVEAISDYWQYFVPVQEGMPKNCSADISRVIDYLDDLMVHGNKSEKHAMKGRFGLESIEHDDDFMSLLQNGPWSWQMNSFTSGYSDFYKFCDAIENVQAGSDVTPDENGVGLDKALSGYASWTKNTLLPGYCQDYGYSDPLETACMDTYNASNLMYTDRTINNPVDRQWTWMLCNEPFSYWQDGAPQTRPSLVSRLVDSDYWQRQCPLFFPPEDDYTLRPGQTVNDVNKYTKGWDLTEAKRLIWINGQYDPWKTSGMSSEFRPGGPFQGNTEQPIQVIPDGIHCSDLRISNAEANAGVKKVVEFEIQQISTWIAEFYSQKELI